MPNTDLRKILLEAVDEGISSLGDSPKQSIFFYLKTSFKMTKEKIPANLTKFTEAIESIFGPGASYLEKLIVRRFYEKLGLEYEEAENWNFIEYIDNAEKHLSFEKGEYNEKE